MAKIRDVLDSKLSIHAVFGDSAGVREMRSLMELFINADPRALKVGDFAVAMAKDVLDPGSPFATPEDMRGVPVIIGHPNKPEEDGKQLSTFKKVLEVTMQGHGFDPQEVRMPYRPELYPVLTNPDKTRMIVGQMVSVDKTNEWKINGINDKLYELDKPRIVGQKDVVPTELFLPEEIDHISVFARADFDGVNSDLFTEAMSNLEIQNHFRSLDRKAPFSNEPILPGIE
jgi:hypothetical protein